MSRSGLTEGWGLSQEENWAYIRFRGAVKSAIRGRNGQAFLKEALRVLDDMEKRELVEGAAERDGSYCMLGAMAHKRHGIQKDHEGYAEELASILQIPDALAREIVYMNDEGTCIKETSEQRYTRVRKWIETQIVA